MKRNFRIKSSSIKSIILIIFGFYFYVDVIAQESIQNIQIHDSLIIKPIWIDSTVRKISFDFWNLESTKFTIPIYFKNNEIINNASFSNSIFENTVEFENTIFDSLADFSNCYFSKNLFLGDDIFNEQIFLYNDTFKGPIEFLNCKILSNLFFDYSTFHGGSLTFDNNIFSGNSRISFEQANLPDTINFIYESNIPNQIDLTAANFEDSSHYRKSNNSYKRSYVLFYKTDISKFHLDYKHFRLYIPAMMENLTNNNIVYITQDEIKATYEALLKNFSDHGQKDSYELLDIEYKKYLWNNSWASFLPCIPFYWNNFGYNKEKVFIWSIFFVLMFTCINFFCLDYLNNVYKLDKINNLPSFKDFHFSIRDSCKRMYYAFIYTSTIFFKLTLKPENIEFNKVLGSVYIILIYTTGIICLAYMANFVLQE